MSRNSLTCKVPKINFCYFCLQRIVLPVGWCFTDWWFGNAEEIKANTSCSLMFCALAVCKKRVKCSKEKKFKLQMSYQSSSRRSSPLSPSGPRFPQLNVLWWIVSERAETQKPSSHVKGRSLHLFISHINIFFCV